MTVRIKKGIFHCALAWLCAALLAVPGYAAAPELPYTLRAALYRVDAQTAAALPGSPDTSLFLAVTIAPRQAGVYLYASKSQAQGKVTEIGLSSGGRSFPGPAIFPQGTEKADPLRPGATTRVFEGEFTVLIAVPEKAAETGTLSLRLTGLACSAVNCTPLTLERVVAVPAAAALASLPDATAAPWWSALRDGVAESLIPVPGGGLESVPRFGAVPFVLRGGASVSPVVPDHSAFLEAIVPVPFSPGLEVGSMGKAVLLGFLAGIILNLMPCVLPVLGIKFSALLNQGGNSPDGMRRFRRHQIFFSLGIMVWFTVLAGLFHWLDLAWGQIFQSPAVVFALAVLLLLLALNLFGVFTLPLIDLRAGRTKNPDFRAFAEGFTATLLATPCGGPLLGGVLSWALLQPLGILALALQCVGLGMAFPYLLLAAFPSLSARLPRPGAWMGVLEQVIGFLLLGTVAYLVSFLPADILPRVAPALVLAAFGGWLWGKRSPVKFFGAACIVIACVWPFYPRPEAAGWADYSHKALAEQLGKRPVLVDFTADWCPTCKLVEATALRESAVRAWQREFDPVFLRVDMTRENPEGEELLRALGSVSIPVIAVFGKGENAHAPLVLRDVVTKGQVRAALEWAAGN